MRGRAFPVAAALLLLGGGATRSQDDAKAIDCAAAQTQHELTHCAARDQAAAERSLEREFRAARGRIEAAANGKEGSAGRRLGREALVKLDSLQGRWRRLVRDQCALEAGLYEGGSIQPMVQARCLAREAHNREGALHVLWAP